MATPLSLRRPEPRWMITAVLVALVFHGLCWFVTRMIAGDAQALGETQRQMGIGLAWMVGAVALWRLSPPPSRLHAVLIVLLCTLFVTCLGSVGALATYVVRGIANRNLVTSFAVYGGLMVLGQLALSLPSSLVLQALALTRRPAAES